MTLARSYTPYHPGLLTDLYHPDSAYVAWRVGRTATTTFDLYARRAPFGGTYLLVAGLEMALEFVRSFHYTDEDIAFLQQIRDYDPEFLSYLQTLRFSGEILAMPEGSIAFPNEPLLRVTYDPRAAIHTAIEVARSARERLGHVLAAVRLDSGDLAGDARYVRKVLDDAGLAEVKIAASGDLDEFSIHELLEAGVPVDSFGVGTSLGVGAGSVERDIEGAALGGVYKEVLYVDERGVHPKIKVAGDKSTWPGKKEVYRRGNFEEDIIQLADEPKPPHSERLLRPVVVDGEVVPGSLPPLSEIWEFAQNNLRPLPDEYHALIAERPYPVQLSQRLV